MSLCAIENLIIFGILLCSAVCNQPPSDCWVSPLLLFPIQLQLWNLKAAEYTAGFSAPWWTNDEPTKNIEIPSQLPSWMPSVLAWTYRSHRAHGSFLRQNVLDIFVAPTHFQAIFLPIPPKSHRIWLDVAGSQSWATPEAMSWGCSYWLCTPMIYQEPSSQEKP